MTCQVGLRHGKFGYGIEVSKATALAIYGCGTLARGWWWTAGTKTYLTNTNIPIRTASLFGSFLFCWHFAQIPRSSCSVDSFHFFLPPKENSHKPRQVTNQGILAATHVGGLRALERHGLHYPKLGRVFSTTLLLMVQKSGGHQLRLVVYPIILQGFFTSQVVQDFF